jgi:hypothetical protein
LIGRRHGGRWNWRHRRLGFKQGKLNVRSCTGLRRTVLRVR